MKPVIAARFAMSALLTLLATFACAALPLAAQETKPVPKDSVRVSVPGCAYGYVFTAGPRNSDQPGSLEITEGMRFRMNGPKKLMGEIKAHEGSMMEITGLMKKGQYKEGVNIGGGVRISPGTSPTSGSLGNATPGQIMIDVESWRQVDGACKSR